MENPTNSFREMNLVLQLIKVTQTILIRTEHSLQTRAEPAVYIVYVENRLILEPSTLLGARNVNKY